MKLYKQGDARSWTVEATPADVVEWVTEHPEAVDDLLAAIGEKRAIEWAILDRDANGEVLGWRQWVRDWADSYPVTAMTLTDLLAAAEDA